MTPFEIKQYYPEETEHENMFLYFASEGTNSEQSFCDYLFRNGSNFVKPSKYTLGYIVKKGAEKGLSNPIALVKYVIQWVENNQDFDSNHSKIIIFFDLDNQSKANIEELIRLKKDYMIYAFSNPKFEVVQLLSIYSDLTTYENKYNEKSFPNKVLENAFSSASRHNSKKRASGEYVAKRINDLLSHRNYDESEILLAKDKFCTNVINVLDDIKNENI